MAPNAKGKGSKGNAQGKGAAGESYEQKTARIQSEISEAAVKGQDLAYLNKVLQGHLKSTQWYPASSTTQSGGGKASTKGKGANKGKGPGPFAATNQANVQLQSSAAEFTAAVDKAVAAALHKVTTKEEQAKVKEDMAARNAEKKRLKAVELEERKAAGSVARPTQLCLWPKCLFAGTYSTSAKCYVCKQPFAAPVPTPTPTPTTPAPTAISDASRKAGELLDGLQSAALAH